MKTFILLALILSSCNSFMFTSKEHFDLMYVKDKDGCGLRQVQVTTTKTGLSCDRLFFKAVTGNDNIVIRELEMRSGAATYYGIGDNGVWYNVKYKIEGKLTSIYIHSVKGNIVLSNKNICAI